MPSSPLPESESEELIAKKKNHRRYNRTFLFIIFSLVAWHYVAGRRAENEWNEFKNRWEAQGEIFDLEELIPPEIPDEDNFTAAPIIAELFDGTETPRLSKLTNFNRIPNLQDAPISKQSLHHTSVRGIIGNERISTQWLLDSPLAHFLKHSESNSTEEDAARAILEALEPLNPVFDELSVATRRPDARFPAEYFGMGSLYAVYSSNLFAAKGALILRALAFFELGNSKSGCQELLTAMRLANHIGSNPTCHQVYIETAYYNLILAVIWDSLESGRLESADMTLLSEALRNQKLKQHLVTAIRTDRAGVLACFDEHITPTKSSRIKISTSDDLAGTIKTLHLSKFLWFKNKSNYCQYIQQHALSTGSKIHRNWINLETALTADSVLYTQLKHSLLKVKLTEILVLLGELPLAEVARSTAYTSTRIDLARVAIALELYHREHNAYPETLAPLAPRYIDALPLDLVTADPLHYRIKADGTPIIYSVGINKTDDGGLLKFDRTLGDWTWQYTLPKGFSKTNWKE